jgi:hypothetical protein
MKNSATSASSAIGSETKNLSVLLLTEVASYYAILKQRQGNRFALPLYATCRAYPKRVLHAHQIFQVVSVARLPARFTANRPNERKLCVLTACGIHSAGSRAK